MDLLNLCLTSTYFQYNGKHYKQLHGTAVRSPVSVVVAEIVMQNIEESALSTCQQTIPLWLRYVDDTFTAVRHDEIDAFHHHLNERNTDIQFTREIEEHGKLLFQHCRGSRDDNSLRTDSSLQETDKYRQITGRVILQPDITKSHYYQDSYTTSATSMQYDRQLIRREQVP